MAEAETPVAALRELSERMLAERRLLIASNRGPAEFQVEDGGSLSSKRGSGGLVTALAALSRFAELSWIASAMTEGDRQVAAGGAAVPVGGDGMRVRFVTLPPRTYHQFYNIVCNQQLWFLQHYMWNTPRYPNISRSIYEAWEDGYVPANAAFAEAIAAEAAASGSQPPYVMVQDYHLYLTPRLVRERLPGAIIQHFTHIPWPDPRYWALLPRTMRDQIFGHLCGADIIGLQTVRDTRNFLQSAESFLPGAEVDYRRSTVWWEGHLTLVRAYPIAIDAGGLQEFAVSDGVREYESRLAPLLGQRTIVRVDRAEPSKNLLRGFRAYDLLLQRYPEYRRTTQLLAFIVPSRTDVGLYQTYTDEVFELIDAINDEYGEAGWQPIVHFYENNYAQAIAAMKHYDVLMVNPVIDGMNLVAKEGPLVNTRDGVLLLSETAGAYEQLGPLALPLAPADIEGMVRALRDALEMPSGERGRRAAGLRQVIAEDDILRWLTRQFSDLHALA